MIKALIFGLFMASLMAFGQQERNFSQWSFNQLTINPAHSGIKRCLDIHTTARSQWTGLEGAPKIGALTVAAPLKAKRKKFLAARHGIGGQVFYEQLGAFQDFKAQLSYAGHFNFSLENRLSLGLAFGIRQLSFNIDKARPLQFDPVINGAASQLFPTATFGAWWNGKNYYFGLSMYELMPQPWNEIGANARTRIHTMVNAGYRYGLSEDWTFLPAMYFLFVPKAPINMQLQAVFDYQSRFSAGLGFRNGESVIGLLSVKTGERFKLVYSVDVVYNSLRKNNLGTHELTIGFMPCRSENKDGSRCPLFE
jgi:type IX secretion system PorP/SprF family membrane protein